ncbi:MULTISPECIES: hypothetical protein [Aquincola]|uniref:hypothetical protein n=1 Tax=Aquincola TaxID=391952 RepID=UPI000614FA83|nr:MULTISPECIES: hypothetical protein [Aquincola]MCR5865658.1 hypothetical protein [Aquincola sp. J276]
MSDTPDFFALPAFKPAEALVQLKRQLRDLRLTERGDRYELAGLAVAELAATDTTLEARLVRRPARTPEWTTHRLASSADVRRFVDHVKSQLARWRDDE